MVTRLPTFIGLSIGAVGKYRAHVDIAAATLVAVFVFLSGVLVLGLFIWAAVKDGQEDRALQGRLGIRRRTRLGR